MSMPSSPAAAVASSRTGGPTRDGASGDGSESGHSSVAASGFVASCCPARAAMTVTLSGAPRTSASPTSVAAASRGESEAAISPISASSTCPERPSLHSTNTSRSATGNGPSRSTATWSWGPMERVMMLRGAAGMSGSPEMPRCSSNSHARE